MNTTNEITWKTDDLSLDWIADYYSAFPGCDGKRRVAMLLSEGAGWLGSRAVGYWDANERELHAIYRSLEKHAKEVR